MKEYLIFSDEGTQKFWSIETNGCYYKTEYGVVGTEGEGGARFFDTEEKALAAAERQLKIMMNKGYHREGEAPVVKAKAGAKGTAKKAAPKKAQPAGANGPAPVKDSGKLQRWHQADSGIWGYDFFLPIEEHFTEEALANPATFAEAPAPAKPAAKAEETIKIAGRKFTRHRFANYCRDLPPKEVQKIWAEAQKAGVDAETLQKALDTAMDSLLTYTLYENGRKNLPWLVEKGGVVEYEDDIKSPYAKAFWQAYKSTGDPYKAAESLDAFLDKACDEMADRLVEALDSVVKAMHAGEYDEKSRIKCLPSEADMEWTTSFKLRGLQSSYYIYIATKDVRHDTLFGGDLKITKNVDDSITSRFLPAKLRPLVEKLGKSGIFKGLATPAVRVLDFDSGGVLYQEVLDESLLAQKRQEAEALVQELEATADFGTKAPLLEYAIGFLLEGPLEADLPRASALIGRFLYSLDPDAEETANEMLWRYDTQYRQLQFERAEWKQANGNYQLARNLMESALEAGYAPAAQKLEEFDELARQREAQQQKPTGSEGEDEQALSFRDFAEQDLFVNTENIIARAYEKGSIRIRFKVEGEEGYSEALDFLNGLLEKGYARLHRGFMIQVRFLAKPVFIKELPKFPKTSCHAFFAKAVMFPAVREKVQKYADLALVKYDWYKDLDGEDSAVPGSFAACALAFCVERYIPMAGQFARNSDGDHQEIQLQVASALAKKYGAVPAVAKAVFDLAAAKGQSGDLGRLPKELYTQPENLRAVVEHIESGVYTQRQLDWYVTRHAGEILPSDAKGNLRKLKALWQAASGDDKLAIEDYYNLYKSYAGAKDKEDYGEDLASAPAHVVVDLPTYQENPPVLVALKDFKKQHPDVKINEAHADEKTGMLFIPQVMDNPYHLEYALGQWDALDNIPMELTLLMCRTGSVVQLGDWVIDLRGPAKAFGAVLYAGKGKPTLLYGRFNTLPLFTRYFKRPYKTPEEAETARLANLLEEAEDYQPADPKGKDAYKRCDDACTALVDERNYATGKLLETFAPQDGKVYDAALLLRARWAGAMKHPAEERAVYEQLAQRRPEFAAYWQEKLQ